MEKFSVLLSVYINEKVENLKLALDSLLVQSVQADEIVLVQDGPLTAELYECIAAYVQKDPDLFNVVVLPENVGLGNALNIGLSKVSNSLVARMDTDDICYPDRFKKQLTFLQEHPEVSVLGTAIQEFDQIPGDLQQFRRLPEKSIELEQYAKYRNPLNHPSVIFRKEAVLKAGSYQDMPLFEDYYLWIRMIQSGFKIANLSEPLLHFRIGNDMIGRRSGYSYLKKEKKFLESIKTLKFIDTKQYVSSLLLKMPLRLLPKSMLSWLYKKFLR